MSYTFFIQLFPATHASWGSLMERAELNKALRRYTFPDTKRSLIQAIVTLCIYLSFITLMIVLVRYHVAMWVIIILSVLTSPIVVKLFIIFHDCCHKSYFRSTRACFWLGHLLGVMSFTAYSDWQRTHLIHHRFMANLEKRGVGDVWLMTLEEFQSASRWTKLCYRIYRHPMMMLVISPPFLFLFLNRFPSKGSGWREILSIVFTDIILAFAIVTISMVVGWQGCVVILLPMMLAASMQGVWLFYVQHQFRRVYWAHSEEWDRFRAAMEGSSFYTMPAIMRWLSGNIGYHHIHHLAPLIPNYRLKECFDEVPVLQEIDSVPCISGLRNINLSLWDEKSGHLISFKEARALDNGR